MKRRFISLSLLCSKDKKNNDVTDPVEIVATDDSIDSLNTPQPTDDSDEGTIGSVNDNTQNMKENDKESASKNDGDKKENNSQTSKKMIELPIYTINDETLETEDTVAMIPADKKITAALIVDEVVKAFNANSYEVDIDSVIQEEDMVIVNFKKNSPPVTDVGAAVEATTLDCISHSIIDNLTSCKAVVFRIEGDHM